MFELDVTIESLFTEDKISISQCLMKLFVEYMRHVLFESVTFHKTIRLVWYFKHPVSA